MDGPRPISYMWPIILESVPISFDKLPVLIHMGILG